MSKRIFALVIMIMMLFAVGCDGGNNNITGGGNATDNHTTEEKTPDGEFFLRGIVKSVDEKKFIAMEVIDSDIAFGIHHVLIDGGTRFLNAAGDSIDRADIKVGDTIEVIFSGQVMLSYPPQIYAQKIILK